MNAESLGEGKISESKIGESKIANHALCGVMWIKLQQLVKLVYQQSALGLPAAPTQGSTFVAYAPRGRLIHQVKCNKQAEVTHYTIQSPTDALCTTGLIELLTECPLPSHQPRLGLNLLLAFIDPCVPFEVSLNFDETV
ncbi:hypothetical protein HC723_14555 [Vibrio sp. S11_S32]|uniref:hypothetical protein n=1 Tax=Vibrio sp. S11_S32 TaxID=2720225 RepID=UPI0016804238|nr:hypothetical protein [Vibrio sp. S11_S32]MBD1577631.1 hypothetical protein [Vibrio sp. S11_S32]